MDCVVFSFFEMKENTFGFFFMQIVFDPYAIHPDEAFIMQLDNIASQYRFLPLNYLMFVVWFFFKTFWRVDASIL